MGLDQNTFINVPFFLKLYMSNLDLPRGQISHDSHIIACE